MRILIIRHADPDYANHTITAAGHLEAKALAEHLQAQGIDEIYCSPLGRARDTMQYTADALGLTPVIEEWTQEVWEELRIDDTPMGATAAWDLHGEDLRRDLSAATASAWDDLSCVNGNGPRIEKLLAAVRENSDRFIRGLGYSRDDGSYTFEQSSEKKIAVFCHGGFGLCWLSHLLALPPALVWSGFWLPPSSITTILFDERTPGRATPRCIGLGDTSHLTAAGLQVTPSGIKGNFW